MAISTGRERRVMRRERTIERRRLKREGENMERELAVISMLSLKRRGRELNLAWRIRDYHSLPSSLTNRSSFLPQRGVSKMREH
jgi:hypothetical protein